MYIMAKTRLKRGAEEGQWMGHVARIAAIPFCMRGKIGEVAAGETVAAIASICS